MAWWLMPRTPDPEVGVRAPLGSNRVVSLSKAHLLPKSTGSTQEAVASSQHDWKIVYRDVKNQSTNQPTNLTLGAQKSFRTNVLSRKQKERQSKS